MRVPVLVFRPVTGSGLNASGAGAAGGRLPPVHLPVDEPERQYLPLQGGDVQHLPLGLHPEHLGQWPGASAWRHQSGQSEQPRVPERHHHEDSGEDGGDVSGAKGN